MADLIGNAGDLQTRITFQSPTINKDAGGAQVSGFSNVATHPTVWSEWIYDHGQELIQSDAAQAVLRATVKIRYRGDVLSSWQIIQNDGSAWKIISPPENVQNRNRWTVFRVERVTGTV